MMTDPKATLLKLNQNLNILQEREAKYAGNAPLDLLNQINDHQQAIDLTRQVITGELDEVEWRESLKPLLLACQDGQVVNIEAETYIAGDQIITNIYEAPPPLLPPAEAKERHDLGILLNKVKTFWIEGVLEKSIHNIALIDLGKETQAEAVAHAWEQVLELPDQSRQTLPPDKKISQIFDEMNRALLILGVPGSGKTITLLQLARDLIAQAEQDESFTQPVPVVFNLSTWTRGQPLIDWLVAELSAKYQIPKRIGRPWLENNRLLPLLDGLDEVKTEERAACVEAINHFGAEYGLSGLVVCSRLEEYTSLSVRLKLNGAIRLQPLTLEQVYDYLEAAGSKLDALRAALEEDEGLQTLAQTPLTLGIMTLVYQDIPAEVLSGQAHDTVETRRKHLLNTYIERMFKRKGKSEVSYSDEQTKEWLAWLAQQMARHNQSIFLIEQLQPSWLSNRIWIWVYMFGSRLMTMLFIGLMCGLVMSILVSKFFSKLNYTLIPRTSDWLVIGLLFGILGGVLFGLIDGMRSERSRKKIILKQAPTRWQQGLNVLVLGLICGIGSGLYFGLFAGPMIGLLFGGAAGLLGGVFFGLRSNRQSLTNDIQTVEALSWSWNRALKTIPLGLIGGFIFGLLDGWAFESVYQELVSGLLNNRGYLILSGGLFWGLVGGAIGAMFGGLNSKIVKTKTIPNQGVWLSLKNALFIGPSFGLIIIVLLLIIGGPIFGLIGQLYGFWNEAVDFGLAGVLVTGTLSSGWYGGIDVIQHYTLRLILWYKGHTPRNYAHFLDYATERIFLQKVGGGYIFIHRLLLEHFAAMDGTTGKYEE